MLNLDSLISSIDIEIIPDLHFIGQYDFSIARIYDIYNNSGDEIIALKRLTTYRKETESIINGLKRFSIRNKKFKRNYQDSDVFGFSITRNKEYFRFIGNYKLSSIRNSTLRRIVKYIRTHNDYSHVLALENEFPLFIAWLNKVIEKLEIRCKFDNEYSEEQTLDLLKITWLGTKKDLAFLFQKLADNGLIESIYGVNHLISQHFTIRGQEITPRSVSQSKHNILSRRGLYQPSSVLLNIFNK